MGTGKILVVDDFEPHLDLVVEALREAGYEPDSTSDSVAAVAAIRKAEYDLVVSDIMMPNLSGLDLLAVVKTASPRTQVILITGLPTRERAMEAVRKGAFAFLEKPYRVDDLLQRIKQALWRAAVADDSAT